MGNICLKSKEQPVPDGVIDKGVNYDTYQYQHQCPDCKKVVDVSSVSWNELSPVIQDRVSEKANKLILPHKCHYCRPSPLKIETS